MKHRRMGAVIVAVLVSTSDITAQPPVFKSRVDAVQVDVLATRRGRPIAALTAADFELLDSGVRQNIESVAIEELPLHLLLVLDTSGSVAGEPLEYLKQAAHAAVASLRPTDHVALITFSHVLQLLSSWSSDAAAIDKAIDRLEAKGATALYDAASAAISAREGFKGPMLVLLFSDGFDTVSWLSPLAVIDQARRSDVVVDAVRLEATAGHDFPPGPRPLPPAPPVQRRQWFLDEPHLMRQEFLPVLADETGGEVVVANGSRDLRAAFLTIVSAFKTRYVLMYSPSDVPPSGWHPIEVRLKHRRGDVRARRGYLR